MKTSKIMALCGMMTALTLVLLVLGAVLEIGIYAAPMLAGICLLPVRKLCGKKYQVLVWLAASLLGLILVPNVEEVLMYLALFGCYPIVRPWFQKWKKWGRLLWKTLYFNAVTLAVQTLVLWVLVPEPMGFGLGIALLLVGNAVFWLYDLLLPKAERKMDILFGKILKNR